MVTNLKLDKPLAHSATSIDIQILGAHSAESSTSKCMSILVNNSLVIDAGGLTSSLSLSDQTKLKAILLTHTHFDHIKDIPSIALNLFYQNRNLKIFCTADVRRAIETYLLNGVLYPRFQEIPPQKPTILFELIRPGETRNIEGLMVTAITANHVENTVAYAITGKDNKSVLYTADTGPGFLDYWEYVYPDLLVVEVTLPDTHRDFARQTKHLTPRFLADELITFKKLKGYLPDIVVVHMSPKFENQIREELTVVSRELAHPITVAHEGLEIRL
jgi:ribonuclease BN (tRNA processing enzyme)